MAKDKLIPEDFLDPEDIEELTSADKKIPGKVIKTDSKEIKKVEETPAFDEEFDYDDVAGIPQTEDDESEKPEEDSSEDDDLDSYEPYDDQNRLKERFEEFVERDDEFDLEHEQALKTKFKDYLKAPNITGKAKSLTGTSRIPAEAIDDSSDILEIEIDESQKKSDKKHRSTIITHKNSDDVIAYIEVICSCGNKTAIKLDYGEEDDFGIFQDTLKESSEDIFDDESLEEEFDPSDEEISEELEEDISNGEEFIAESGNLDKDAEVTDSELSEEANDPDEIDDTLESSGSEEEKE